MRSGGLRIFHNCLNSVRLSKQARSDVLLAAPLNTCETDVEEYPWLRRAFSCIPCMQIRISAVCTHMTKFYLTNTVSTRVKDENEEPLRSVTSCNVKIPSPFHTYVTIPAYLGTSRSLFSWFSTIKNGIQW